jgi:hypothetical protein
LSPLNNQAADPPHFQANDLITRGKDGKVDDQFKALVEENQQQAQEYEKKRKENPESSRKTWWTSDPHGSEVTQVQTGIVRTVLLLIVLVPVLAVAQAPQTYSDVREVEESGDVVGTELTLQVAGEAVNGTLRHYEGTEPESVAVTGRLVQSSLTRSGSYSEGKVQITARVQNDRVIGKLSYHLNGQTNDVELNLPRVERPRMQKAATPAMSHWLQQIGFTEGAKVNVAAENGRLVLTVAE